MSKEALTLQNLQIRLLFDPPKSADESPAFALKWDDQPEVLEQAARDAVTEIEAGLPGFLMVQGAPGT